MIRGAGGGWGAHETITRILDLLPHSPFQRELVRRPGEGVRCASVRCTFLDGVPGDAELLVARKESMRGGRVVTCVFVRYWTNFLDRG